MVDDVPKAEALEDGTFKLDLSAKPAEQEVEEEKPEAVEEIADKQIPGFGEVFRNISLKTVGTSAIQSRACAVLANGKYIFALPGSSGGVTDAWDGILKSQLDINNKPCNFVELFPRLKEK